jgi:hypothetical protein
VRDYVSYWVNTTYSSERGRYKSIGIAFSADGTLSKIKSGKDSKSTNLLVPFPAVHSNSAPPASSEGLASRACFPARSVTLPLPKSASPPPVACDGTDRAEAGRRESRDTEGRTGTARVKFATRASTALASASIRAASRSRWRCRSMACSWWLR